MSIRIRVVDGVTVALCAARSVAKPGDIYLDDAAHLALSEKFGADFNSMGFMVPTPIDEHAEIREREESNNPNREWWNQTYGRAGGDTFRIASFGLVEDPQAPVHRVVPRSNGALDDPVTDILIATIERWPNAWGPKNQYYRKSVFNRPAPASCDCPAGDGHNCKAPPEECGARARLNGRLSVRQWFRQMRAADFERDLLPTITYEGVEDIDILHDQAAKHPGWTLFHTQTVVNRETAAHYLKPDPAAFLFIHTSRGWKIEDLATCFERGGQPEWDQTDYSRDCVWRGLSRSIYPQFSSKVPSSSRGITRDDLHRFVRCDDANRSDRR